ncbi:unnamed protein product [Larinioides sclopetarius]|uniref:Uncharacterized protein n=1 Tax=Larinioides sclopetarius TaxID=280406 RepID=A0AAV1ZFL4_9ARAC
MVLPVHILLSLLYILRDIADVKCQEWLDHPDVDRHIQLGRELLTQGLYDDALSHYHAAVGRI